MQVFLTQDHLAIVMEYVNGGDMFNYVKRRGGLEEDEGRDASANFMIKTQLWMCTRWTAEVKTRL